MDQRVKRTGKDRSGDITSLCGDWGSVTKAVAIRDIEGPSTPGYYVQDSSGQRANVRVVMGSTGKYLRSDPNSACRDNLDNLPDC